MNVRSLDERVRDDKDRTLDWKSILDASPFSTLIFTPDLVLLHCNAAHYRNSGVPSEDLRGRFMFDVFPKNPDGKGPDTEATIRSSVARVLETRALHEPPIQRHDLVTDDGGFEPRYWRIIHSPIVERGEIVAIRQDSWDVTASVLEAERQETVRRVAGSLAGIAFWELDVEADRIVHTPEFDLLFGFPLDDGAAKDRPFSTYAERFHEDDRQMIETAISDLMKEGVGAVREFEYKVVRPDGDIRHALVRGEVSLSDKAQPILAGITVDVSDLHDKEEKLTELVREKEALLDEVNHRVKNSLQLVSSILALEARKADEGESTRLQSAARRVQSVAAVHAALYQGQDVSTVEMGAHLREFSAHLADSLGAESRSIALVVDSDETRLDASEAISVALIVNELVTNAFKHAFPQEAPDGAQVAVSFRTEADGSHVLIVEDNGRMVGTALTGPSSPQEQHDRLAAGNGLGMQLIATITRQLEAKVTQEQDRGWRTRIEFGI